MIANNIFWLVDRRGDKQIDDERNVCTTVKGSLHNKERLRDSKTFGTSSPSLTAAGHLEFRQVSDLPGFEQGAGAFDHCKCSWLTFRIQLSFGTMNFKRHALRVSRLLWLSM